MTPLRAALLAGLAAPVIYAVAVVAGDWFDPRYNAVANTISELTMVGAPSRVAVAAVFVVYNFLVIAFALALPRAMAGANRRGIAVAALLLIVVAAAGLGMSALFPTDMPGAPLTAVGTAHIALAAVASLGTMATVGAVAWATWRAPGWRGVAMLSVVCLAAIVATGLWTAATTAQLAPTMGLAERATIGSFEVWLFALAALVLRRQ
ncbi:MAG: DUF998 domain-containing protein [Bauldia sp.]